MTRAMVTNASALTSGSLDDIKHVTLILSRADGFQHAADCLRSATRLANHLAHCDFGYRQLEYGFTTVFERLDLHALGAADERLGMSSTRVLTCASVIWGMFPQEYAWLIRRLWLRSQAASKPGSERDRTVVRPCPPSNPRDPSEYSRLQGSCAD